MKKYLTLLLRLLLVSVAFAQKGVRPNFVILFADDLGYSDIGCYGGEIKTPNLDKLASEGILFDRAYCQSAICMPSRVSLLNGLRPENFTSTRKLYFGSIKFSNKKIFK